MSFLNKVRQKIGETIEKTTSKTMTGASKEAYEDEQAKRKEKAPEQAVDALIEVPFQKQDLQNLDQLLEQAELIDDRHLWLAGFPNYKTNQNAVAANLFSGKKNLAFVMIHRDLYYFAHFEKDRLKTYHVFRKQEIARVEAKAALVGAPTLKIKLKTGKSFSIAVTENKANFKLMIDALQ